MTMISLIKNAQFVQNFNMTMISLTVKFPFNTNVIGNSLQISLDIIRKLNMVL